MKLFNGRVSKPEARELGYIQSLRELEAKLAAYEYPLRENNWVKVRQEVWDAKEAENKALREAILDWWNGAPDDADCDERLGQVAAALIKEKSDG